MMPEDEGEIFYQEAVRHLEPDGWHVELRDFPPRFFIQVDHVLSSGYGWGFVRGARDNTARFENFMREPEFEAIRTRPEKIEHAELIGSIRMASFSLQWPPSVLESLAPILESFALLTREESEWLYTVGGAKWTLEDRR
jgi:hypothetical protein